jgi:hypothetical protein
MASTRFVALALAVTLSAQAQIATQPIPAPIMSSIAPPVIGFVDLSVNGGTQITGVGDDTVHAIVTTVGNGMFPAGNVLIGNNGVACAGISSGAIGYTNAAILLAYIPNLIPAQSWVPTGLPQNLASGILAFWDDLHPGGAGSIWWKEQGGVLYIMWKDEFHFGAITGGQTITFEIQVFSDPDFGAPWIQIVYPDTVFGGTAAANDGGASATVGLVHQGGTIAGNGQWGFNTASVPSGTVLSFRPSTVIAGSSPLGPGSIQLTLRRGPPSGSYFLAATTFAGAFPNGWLYGLDIPFPELMSELSAGAPFSGPINLTPGTAVVGPFSGLPSGLTVHAIAFGTNPGASGPAVVTAPIAYTIP